MLKNLSKSQKLFFILSKVDNMNLIFDKFDSTGIKSLETISTILAKNFMRKNNEIITKYLLSIDILLNVSNIFKHFKYGFDSIFDSIKLKKSDSIFKLPKQLVFGIFHSALLFINGINSSLIQFFVQLKNITDFYYGNTIRYKINPQFGEIDLKRKWFFYNCLRENSKKELSKKFMFSKKIYFYLNTSLNGDYNRLISINFFFQNSTNKKNKLQLVARNALSGFFKIVFYPLKVFVEFSEYFNKLMYRREEYKMKKIRSSRYINKNSCKIEEYSETRALAYEKLIKNKKQLNVLEEIENYFNLNSKESIILTNSRIIHINTKNQSFELKSINLNSIFFFFIEDVSNSNVLKIFYYDDKTNQNLLNKINQNISEVDSCMMFNSRKKDNLCLKILILHSRSSINKSSLNNIYDALKEHEICRKLSTKFLNEMTTI